MILSRHDSVIFCFKFVLIREIRVSTLHRQGKFDQIRPNSTKKIFLSAVGVSYCTFFEFVLAKKVRTDPTAWPINKSLNPRSLMKPPEFPQPDHGTWTKACSKFKVRGSKFEVGPAVVQTSQRSTINLQLAHD